MFYIPRRGISDIRFGAGRGTTEEFFCIYPGGTRQFACDVKCLRMQEKPGSHTGKSQAAHAGKKPGGAHRKKPGHARIICPGTALLPYRISHSASPHLIQRLTASRIAPPQSGPRRRRRWPCACEGTAPGADQRPKRVPKAVPPPFHKNSDCSARLRSRG